MQSLVLILILISSTAFGSDLEAILGGLNSKDLLAENCDPSLSKLEACALEVCGSPTNVPSAGLTDENFKKNVLGGTEFDHAGEIETLKTGLRTHLQNYESARAGIEKLKQENKLSISTEDWNDFTWEMEASLAFSRYVKFTPQLNLPEKSRLKVVIETPPGSSPEYLKALNAWASKRKEFILGDNYSKLAMGFYNKEQAEQIARKEFSKYPAPIESSTPEYRDHWNTIKTRLESITSYQEAYYAFSGMGSLERMKGEKPKIKKTVNTCEDKLCRDGVKAFHRDVYVSKLVSSVSSGKGITEEQINAKAEECYADHIYHKYTEKISQGMKENLPNVLDKLISQGLEGFPLSCKEKFRKHVEDKIQVKYEKKLEGFSSLPKTLETILETGKLGMLVNYQNIDILSTYPGCSSFNPGGNSYGNFEILLSPFTCHHLPYGEGVVAHEMGHAFDDAVKLGLLGEECRGPLMQMRSCVSEQFMTENLKLNKDYPKMFDNDLWKTEEDTADIFAFRATKNGVQFKCALLSQSEDRSKYIFNEMHDFNESHSPSMVRVVREAAYRGKTISPLCVEAMNESYPNFKLNICPFPESKKP